jgi:hypothetical protein
MIVARARFTAPLSPNGKVLIAGRDTIVNSLAQGFR